MPHEVVWVGYDAKPPYLPVCIANTSQTLADMMGVSVNTIYSAISRASRGEQTNNRYAKVLIEGDDREEDIQWPTKQSG